MTSSTEPPLLLERHGAIATLRFNRPASMNALDVPTALALRDAVRAMAQKAREENEALKARLDALQGGPQG